ncbi:TaqI-like C-terminal specificity domain-containing protein [Olleya sp. YS]|uniref:type IIG restriction enzyme/methyltransferase n=1 Tax=Olleya sp. YS TaxID=3028318 RepID=UPI0024341505|nr:TaqI-like C-terminal specificity domain-containing protein [Olleya sp. YS]WGD34737.1 TaqI-like C-terminal specificity domain-containing protein [Olleya sp. YS]
MNKLRTRKALNPAYRKHKPLRKVVNNFTEQLQVCIDAVKLSDDNGESEEHIKSHFKDFFTNTFYGQNYINTKDRIDLAIYIDATASSDVGVIIEAKKPSNKAEFLTTENLNRKALQELLLYYLRERVDNENNNIKHLIATNGYEWFLFKAEDFYNYFYKNKALLKEYKSFRDGLKDTTKNELFYDEIAKKYINEVQETLPFVHLDFSKTKFESLKDAHLNTLYKIFSDVHLLGHSFGNDSNQLNKTFYNELLHIIGLEEIKEKGKKIISRKSEKGRDYASLLENTIVILEDRDYLANVKSVENGSEKAFNVGLELCLTWVNRILFLKLLESQLLAYHKQDSKYKFLNSSFINGFDELNDLFFSALAKQEDERHPKYKDKYKNIPYLNSSLFERNTLENEAFEISALNNDAIEVFSNTVLKDTKGKRLKGKLSTLDYLFQFLDAYDFATDGNEGIEDSQETKSLINASVLGLIFEKINGYKEGSFYTPAYITMYMCKEMLRRAVIQKFKEQENDQIETFEDLQSYCSKHFKIDDLKRFNTIINGFRICDPAVGSGHFLVSALNELIVIKKDLGILVDAKGLPLRCDIEIVNDELYVIDDKGLLFEYNPTDKESTRIQHTLFHEKQTLIENCLFGVDINPNSVKICRLRLWIELLKNAYYTKENRLQTLPNIDINIKCGNSLISRFHLEDDLKDAFKGKEVNYSFADYKNAVAEYKETNSKDRKREVLQIIDEVKNNFKSTLDNAFISKFQKAQGEYINEEERLKNLKAFGEKIKKTEKDNLKKLKNKAEATYLEKEEIVNNAIYNNAFEWRFEFPEVLADDGSYIGFDAIIGNPPYVFTRDSDFGEGFKDYVANYIKKHKIGTENKGLNIQTNKINLFGLFVVRGLDIMNKNAELSYIIPNGLLRATTLEAIRKYLLEKTNIYSIVDLDKGVFDGVTISTIILELNKSFLDESEIKLKSNSVINSVKQSFFLQNVSYTINNFIDNSTVKIIDKIKESTYPMGDDFLFISPGIDGDKEKYIANTKINEDYKPLLFGKDFKNYRIDFNNNYILYDNNLLNRARNEEIFLAKKKILIQRISGGLSPLTAVLDDNQFYTFNSVNNLILKEGREHLYSVYLALLNSKLINWYYALMFSNRSNLTVNISKTFLEKIPIKKIPDEVILPFTLLTTKITKAKADNQNSDTTTLEKEIDQMVYKLYDLTPEEIAIVENS